MMLIRMASKEDPRSYVLIDVEKTSRKEDKSEEVVYQEEEVFSKEVSEGTPRSSRFWKKWKIDSAFGLLPSENTTNSSNPLWIWNQLHMDVKILCFHPSDRVQFIPKGGLLPSNSVVRRNEQIKLKAGL